MNIYLVRHGETDANAAHLFCGHTDPPLNAKGIKQAQKLKQKLTGIHFHAVYTSPLQRCIETTRLISDQTYFKKEALKEINFGLWENRNIHYIKDNYKKEYESWMNHWKEFCFPEGESYYKFQLRVNGVVAELLAHDSGNILIVSHQGVLRILLCSIMDISDDLQWQFIFSHGDYSIISTDGMLANLICLNK